jgi:predicted nucleic acid-binding Zn ribbon protein
MNSRARGNSMHTIFYVIGVVVVVLVVLRLAGFA